MNNPQWIDGEGLNPIQKKWILLGLLVVLCIASLGVFFLNLNSYPMQNWDEGVHSQVTQEIVSTGDYWTLHYQGENYFRKPPLKIWLTAPMVSLFGDSNWVFRFWSAFSGMITALVLAYFVYKKEKNYLTGFFSGLFFISGQYILYHAFRTGEMDGLLIALLTLGFFAYWKGKTEHKWLIVMGVAFGLSIMTKSLAGMIGPMAVFLDIFIRRDWKLLRQKYLWYGIAAFLLVSVPWHLSMLYMYGQEFWDEYIGFHIVDRAFEQLYADLPWFWYVKMFISRFFPFSILAIGGALFTLFELLKKNSSRLFLLLWLVIPLVLYSVIKTKFEWYILPMYPAAAWLAALFVQWVFEKYSKVIYSVLGLGTFFLSVALLPRAIIPGSKIYWFAPQAYMTDALREFISNPYLVSLIFVLLFSIVVWILTKRVSWVPKLAIVLVVLYLIGFGYGRNLGIAVTQPTSSVFTDMLIVLQERDIKTVDVFHSDFYMKPAGYFEIARGGIELIEMTDMDEKKLDSAIITEVLIDHDDLELIGSFAQYNIYVER